MALNTSTCNHCNNLIMDESTLNCSHCCKRYHETCVSVYLGDHISVNSWICSECISTIFPFNQYVHKTDFIDVLSESWYNFTDISFNDLGYKCFNPFDLNVNDNEGVFVDNNPDIQYYKDLSFNLTNNCNYFFENAFF